MIAASNNDGSFFAEGDLLDLHLRDWTGRVVLPPVRVVHLVQVEPVAHAIYSKFIARQIQDRAAAVIISVFCRQAGSSQRRYVHDATNVLNFLNLAIVASQDEPIEMLAVRECDRYTS